MDNRRGRQSRQGDTNRESQVNPEGLAACADLPIATENLESLMFDQQLMEVVCKRENLKQALKRVQQNRGKPGIDGMNVDDLGGYLKANWPEIKEQLLNGSYQPQPILRVEIPKPGKQEKRKLGIPTVVDRFIQQAVLQTLQEKWDCTFSEHSYGFRPKRSAHQAIAKAQSYLKAGHNIVVDIDLEAFFDRVNHDRLMSRLAQRPTDRRQTGTETDQSLPDGRNHGEWSHQGAHRRDTTRRATLPIPLQCSAGRTGSRTGKARPPLCTLC